MNNKRKKYLLKCLELDMLDNEEIVDLLNYINNLEKGIKSAIWQLEHNIRPQALQRDIYY